MAKVQIQTTADGEKTQSKALGFDSNVYAKGIGQRWGNWSGVAGGAVAATATYFLRGKPEGFFSRITHSMGTPLALVGAAFVGWLGVGTVGKIVGKSRGTKEANEIKQEVLQTLAENEGLKRENAVLKEFGGAEAQTKKFTDHLSSRAEHGSHAGAAAHEQAKTEHEGAAR